MEWFRREYPDYVIEDSPSGKYVVQSQRGLQGDRAIGRKFYLTIKDHFAKFGLLPCPQEPALYLYRKDDVTLLVNTSTDDFLCAFSDVSIFYKLEAHLKEIFGLTKKEGPQFEYLNLRITQSKYGISYDQTGHIIDSIVHHFFPPDSTERLKDVHTPFRTDSQFEQDLSEQLPATGNHLRELEKRYGGSYSKLIGMLNHPYCWTRQDIGFALSRLGKYTGAPNPASFEGLYRIARYLATHRNCPVMYPRRSIQGFHSLRVDFDPPKFEEILLPNGLLLIIDSDHAQDMRTRRSCHHLQALVHGVALDWKHEQQRCVALHSTDSKIRGVFSCVKRGLTVQDVAIYIGMQNDSLLPTPIYEDSQPCIDVLEAKTVTTRVKHIAVPIHFIHEHINDGRFVMRKIGTNLNLSDSGTKPNPAPIHFRQYDHTTGVRFYPPKGSDHYRLLQLETFLTSPYIRGTTTTTPSPNLPEPSS